MTTLGIVGAGAVGQTLATAVTSAGLSESLLVNSRTGQQAQALVDDLNDLATATGSRTRATAGALTDLFACDALVITARASFTNNASTNVRLAGAAANAPVIRLLAAIMRGYRGTVVMVTNPVDLMSRLFAEFSGCSRVYGVGSNLDTARYHLALARHLDVPACAISGHVIGEHGDNAVICCSTTTVNGEPVPVPLKAVRDELRARPGRISAGIGRTRSGPSGAVLHTLRLALGHLDGTTELTAEHDGGWYGIPLRFTAGQPIPCLPPLDQTETRLLEAAARKLRSAYQQLPEGTP
ncbi:NAD(P)-binding domain-containing protein [Streptomyces sp. G1]|uniref:lactate/malate family dehydrogenase n=1 Tax=Streptomyces sp. G1 TaxID=361572 RepID=UPI0020302EB6|nr:NAD(P)-binding domain-containing protein [Streptomyces sp. G1]MCM1967761.1 NAD(P)-binding domain-containing protein [Streptomyces sp. G1]